MQALAERARQVLGVGRDMFVPSSLEAHDMTLKELEVFTGPLESMLKAAEQLKSDTQEFLDSSATYVSKCPFPRMWIQSSPTEHATALHVPAPAEHAAWYDAETHDVVVQAVPRSVSYAIERELVAPMKQWMLGYEVAKSTYSNLVGRRLAYDAARRRLVNAAAKAASEESHQVVGAAAGSQEVLVVTGGPHLAELQEMAAAISPELAEFETEVEALDDALMWLVSGAARLKALVADACGGAAAAAQAWQVPEGIMPPLPEKTTIGQDIEIAMTVSEAPFGELGTGSTTATIAGNGKGQGGIGSLHSPSGGGPVDIVKDSIMPSRDSDQPTAISNRGSDQGHGQHITPAADLSGVLPSDELVYGGGVAPPAATHPPTGGGPGDLLRDSLLSSSSSVSSDEADPDGHRLHNAPAADLTSTLPSDEKVYGGGMAPPTAAHPPSGGGLLEVLQDAVPKLPSTASAAAAAEASAPETVSWPSRSYSGEGVGRVDVTSPKEHEAMERAARRSTGVGLAASPEVTVAEPEKKQLSTVVLPTTHTESLAAAAATAGSGSGINAKSFSDNVSTQALPAAAAAHPDADSSSSSSSTGAEKRGGILAAIAKTLADATVALTGSTSVASDTDVHSEIHDEATAETASFSGPELPQQAATAAADTAAEGEKQQQQQGPGFEFKVQGVAETAAGYEGSWFGPGPVAAGKDMHIGPVPPASESAPAPGSAVWMKDATPPGGAAAAGVKVHDTAPQPEQGSMHIGPVPPASESAPTPGSAVWMKGATPPGGAAAETTLDMPPPTATAVSKGARTSAPDTDSSPTDAATLPTEAGGTRVSDTKPMAEVTTPATDTGSSGSKSTPAVGAAQAAEAPAGEGDRVGGKAGIDLSKMLPTYENLPGTTKAKPSGGGVAALLRDTLMGPNAAEESK